MPQLFTNNARALVLTAISAVDTTILITSLLADSFPTANTNGAAVGPSTNWFKATLEDSAGNVEITYVRTRASGSNVFSNVQRGQEGTTARSFGVGSIVSLRLTAADHSAVRELVDGAAQRSMLALSSGAGTVGALDGAAGAFWEDTQAFIDWQVIFNSFNATAPSIAALKLMDGTRNKFVRTLSYYGNSDVASRSLYQSDLADTTSIDDGGGVVVGADETRWKLIVEDTVRIKQFGAKGDGVTDDFASIHACVNWAAARAHRPTVGIDAGVFLIGADACLTPTTVTAGKGLKFQGAGWLTSILRLNPGGTDLHFYNNGSTPRLQLCTFDDIGFEGMDPADFSEMDDISDHALSFRLWATTASGGHEQGFVFNRCIFRFLAQMYETAGDNNASEMKFFGCRASSIKTQVANINNAQSFNHEFISTDLESIYGDVFKIGTAGGGAIKVTGGSIIMSERTGATATTDTYLFNGQGSTGPGQYPFTMTGVRLEMHGDHTKLAKTGDQLQFDIKINDTLFEDQGSAPKTGWLEINAFSTAYLRGCTLYEQIGTPIRITAGSASLFGQSGRVTFDDCGLPVDFSDRCTIKAYSGAIRAINCHGLNVGAISAGLHYAHDFDLHWNQGTAGQFGVWDVGTSLRSVGSPTDNSLRLKTVQLKLPTEFWPDTNEHTIKMPKNSIIKAIHLRKPPGGAVSTATTYRVSDNTKTTHHLASTSAQANLAHSASVDNYFYAVGSANDDRTLRLNSSVAHANTAQGGIVLIQYY